MNREIKFRGFDEENEQWVYGWVTRLQEGATIINTRLPIPIATKDRNGAELLLEKFGLANILWACGGPEPGGE